ncbi:MAG: enoyl-CoA hydratase/isomerase family protein [Gammaproteobacteria bacterium]|nr:enoyl-CoA hydratase/isomerase family protein [Gammaproteobacteria bacterium]
MLELSESGQIAVLRMNRPPVNALDTELCAALSDAIARAQADGAGGVVIAGQPGIFSGGLDVPALLELDRDAIREFWTLFFGVLRSITASTVPVAGAITGHSPAGGAVIALQCDYRVAADGDYKIGLNEVQVGLPIPAPIVTAMVELVGYRTARRLTTRGLMIPMAEAQALGLVDELVPDEQVVGRAIAWCEEMNDLPPIAMNTTRQQLNAFRLASLDSQYDVDTVTSHWFSDETQASMRALVARLKGSE